METEERDATSRASFKCTNCLKTFTDLEVCKLFVNCRVFLKVFNCIIYKSKKNKIWSKFEKHNFITL